MDVVAIECDYTSTDDGTIHAVSRVVLIDYSGQVLFDTKVKLPEHLFPADSVVFSRTDERMSFYEAGLQVGKLIQNKVVAGYNVIGTLKSLRLYHAWQNCRDATKYYPYMTRNSNSDGTLGPSSPRPFEELTREFLHIEYSENIVDRAKHGLSLYASVKDVWDTKIAIGFQKAKEGNKQTPTNSLEPSDRELHDWKQDPSINTDEFIYSWNLPPPRRLLSENPWAYDEKDSELNLRNIFTARGDSTSSPNVDLFITSKFLA